MSFVVSYNPSSSAFRRVPPGAWIARCVGLIDLGTQRNEAYQNEARKLRVEWEVFGEDDNGVALVADVNGKDMPLKISRNFTLSLHEKAALRKFLAGWRGKDFTAEELAGFDISKLLGAYCLLNVTEREASNGKTYADVAGISPLPKSMNAAKPAGVHPLTTFQLSAFDQKTYDGFHDALKTLIAQSPEYAAATSPKAPTPAKHGPMGKPEPAQKAEAKPAGGAGSGTAFDDMDSDVPF